MLPLLFIVSGCPLADEGFSSPGLASSGNTEPVAVVHRVTGIVWTTFPGTREQVSSEQFDWLPIGTHLSTGVGSELVLMLLDGSRFCVMASSRARVETEGVVAETGAVVRLPDFPRIAAFTPRRLPEGLDRFRHGAVRIRGSGSQHNDPNKVAAHLTERRRVIARTEPARMRHFLVIENETGNTLFQAEVGDGLLLPADVLATGATFTLRVLSGHDRAQWRE